MQSTLERFEVAAKLIESELITRFTDDQKLKLYGLFKQVKVGDCNTARPGMFDLKGKAKWDAWNANKGKSAEDCAKTYIDLVKEVLPADAASI